MLKMLAKVERGRDVNVLLSDGFSFQRPRVVSTNPVARLIYVPALQGRGWGRRGKSLLR